MHDLAGRLAVQRLNVQGRSGGGKPKRRRGRVTLRDTGAFVWCMTDSSRARLGDGEVVCENEWQRRRW